jgi:hypothetical protein
VRDMHDAPGYALGPPLVDVDRDPVGVGDGQGLRHPETLGFSCQDVENGRDSRCRPTGEGEFAGTGAEAEGVPAGDAELVGLVSVAGFGVVADLAWAVGLGVVVGGDVTGTGAGEAEDGVVAGVTPTVATGGGLISR